MKAPRRKTRAWLATQPIDTLAKSLSRPTEGLLPWDMIESQVDYLGVRRACEKVEAYLNKVAKRRDLEALAATVSRPSKSPVDWVKSFL